MLWDSAGGPSLEKSPEKVMVRLRTGPGERDWAAVAVGGDPRTRRWCQGRQRGRNLHTLAGPTPAGSCPRPHPPTQGQGPEHLRANCRCKGHSQWVQQGGWL